LTAIVLLAVLCLYIDNVLYQHLTTFVLIRSVDYGELGVELFELLLEEDVVYVGTVKARFYFHLQNF